MIEPSIALRDSGMSGPLKTDKPSQKTGGQAFWFSVGTAVALAVAGLMFLVDLLTTIDIRFIFMAIAGAGFSVS